MERLAVLVLVSVTLLVGCTPAGRDQYSAWDQEFANRPPRFAQAVTALWITQYTEDGDTGRFRRSSAWGEVPEKLVPEGASAYSVAVPLLVQGETSDGPVSDQFTTVLVRVVRSGEQFTLSPNDALPGLVVGWVDSAARTVRFRGKLVGPGPDRTLWQFQARF